MLYADYGITLFEGVSVVCLTKMRKNDNIKAVSHGYCGDNFMDKYKKNGRFSFTFDKK